VADALRALLPGLRKGGTLAVTGGSSLVLALLAPVSQAGGWVGVVGMPGLGALAAAQAGIALDRLALVPCPGPEWPTVVAALLDGLDVVVVAPGGPVAHRIGSRLSARARARGAVLLPCGAWPGADLTLAAEHVRWEGLAPGHGRLRGRELAVTARGRGAAARSSRVRVLLPGPTGRLVAVPARGRPALTVVDGRAA
jgi:hypothetical protein